MNVTFPIIPAEGAILEVVGSKPALTAQALAQELAATKGLTLPKATLYRHLQSLLAAQMIVKVNGQHFLNRVWLSHLEQFATGAKQRLESPTAGSVFPLQEGQTLRFEADSLRGLDPIWNDILMQLTTHAKASHWYAYNSHPWHSLGMRETELRLFSGLLSQDRTITMTFGGETFLDRYGAGLIQLPGFISHTRVVPEFPGEGYALWIAGDYGVECIFPDSVSNQFAYFFHSVQSIANFNVELFSDLFTMRARTSITLFRSKARCERMRSLLANGRKKHASKD